MSIEQARAEAVVWKKESQARLKSALALLREFRKSLDKLCDGLRSTAVAVERDATRVAKMYERALDEESEEYDSDWDMMTTLQEIPVIADEADDTKLQAGEAIEGLISQLEEVIEAVKAIES
jgi:hypothetical protein